MNSISSSSSIPSIFAGWAAGPAAVPAAVAVVAAAVVVDDERLLV